MHRFCVIIPVFNSDRYLERCLDSVLCQKYKSLEIIAVDDGSTDNSASILDSYSIHEPNFHVIHKQNEGPLLARVDAIRAANSEYCIFLDSDDVLSSDFFSVLEAEMLMENHDIYLYNYITINELGKKVKSEEPLFINGTVFCEENKNVLLEAIIDGKLNALWTKAIKTNLLKSDPTDYNQYRNIFIGEDLLLSLYVMTIAHTIKYIDCPLYYYRMSSGSICRSLDERKLKSIISVNSVLHTYMRIWDFEDENHEKRFQIVYGKQVLEYIKSFIYMKIGFAGSNAIYKKYCESDAIFRRFLQLKSSQVEENFSFYNKLLILLLRKGQFKTFYLIVWSKSWSIKVAE